MSTIPVTIPNTAQRIIDTPCGELQIMVSWPLGWTEDGQPCDDEKLSDVPVIFVLDGNAYFATATDIVRRHQFVSRKKAIAVGIAHPISDAVFCMGRRAFDMTPPSKKGLPTWKPRPGQASGGGPEIKYGGAAAFQEAIVKNVIPTVAKMLPSIRLGEMQKVLFGHSFGGLFTLVSLFTDPGVFDTYIAASPSIWFNDCSIKEQEDDFLAKSASSGTKAKLYITTGTAEEDLLQKPGEADDWFAKRRGDVKAKRMNQNAIELAARLRGSGKLDDVWLQIFDLEDHGSSAVCGLQRGINKVLGEWWVGE